MVEKPYNEKVKQIDQSQKIEIYDQKEMKLLKVWLKDRKEAEQIRNKGKVEKFYYGFIQSHLLIQEYKRVLKFNQFTNDLNKSTKKKLEGIALLKFLPETPQIEPKSYQPHLDLYKF
ncbi:unnamed protein product [Paramecium sonneborni]|uniref:Uncharacterized protein n=1 Tax=Paramecium sonneborni TaxID=65129 RepID=A0A8S1Q4H7_9CILI|nr:unnamed protein product [Paramecium sonneborni]